MPRREFPRDVYAQIVHRATNADGHIVCEGCGFVLGKKPYHIDHTIADALQVDKRRKLTAAEGKLLGVECCHAPKTKIDVKVIAEAKRREAIHLGIKRASGKLRGAQFAKSEKSVRRLEKAAAKAFLPPRSLFVRGQLMQPLSHGEIDGE